MKNKNLCFLFNGLMILSQVNILVAIADSGKENDMHIPYSDVFKKLDPKYGLIYGSPDSLFFLHYCLPGFVPIGEGDCKLGKAPGEDPHVVQVQYDYALNDSSKRGLLEGGGAFLFPFPLNVNLKDKTPYLVKYKKTAERAKELGYQVVKSKDKLTYKYKGLASYESEKMPGRWWVPINLSEYQTKLGNPPVFLCSSSFCMLTLDQSNGWVVRATFNEIVLNDWRSFYVQFNQSINELMN